MKIKTKVKAGNVLWGDKSSG